METLEIGDKTCRDKWPTKEESVMNNRLKGLILLLVGLAIVFPLFSQFILKNIIVIIGFYLVYVGLQLLFGFSEKKFKKDT